MKAPEKTALPLQHQALSEKLKTGGNEVQINNNKNNAKAKKKNRTVLLCDYLYALKMDGRQALGRLTVYTVLKCMHDRSDLMKCVNIWNMCAERERVHARSLS